MEVLNDILGYKNRKIYQDTNYFSFSLDSVMLANFVKLRIRDKNILDVGCGNGVIPLILSLKTQKMIIGVELQKKLCNLAIKSVKYNKLDDQIKIVNMNVKDFSKKDENINHYDVIVCNPPYFKITDNSMVNESEEKLIARHEVELNLQDLIFCVKKMLNSDGNFFLVHRADRLLEILDILRREKIEPKRIRFVYYNINRESNLVLIEGQMNGKIGLKIEKPFILYNDDGSYTKEYEKMLVEVI